MKILSTGSTGYIALLPLLPEHRHQVVCRVRNKNRFGAEKFAGFDLEVIEVDFLKKESLAHIPADTYVEYYLMHSMSSGKNYFSQAGLLTAVNFKHAVEQTNAKQVVFLSGIVNHRNLSKHLFSRLNIEEALKYTNQKNQ